MRIYYYVSDYISDQRTGAAYKTCLQRLGHTLVESPDNGDLAILHDVPSNYPHLVARLPSRLPRVGYAVWETPQLPTRFQEGVALVDAVWTCSAFSRAAFAPYVPTFVLPHMVERPRLSPAALEHMARRLGLTNEHRRREFLFYTIVDTVNPRKNLPTLLAAFHTAFPGDESDVRLVVKQYRLPQEFSALPRIVDLPDMLDDEEIAALHALCNVYVSAHHAEAWGLPLSEALSFGNPVIATGYSGNMEFMHADNSIPVAYTLTSVSEAMCRALPLFTPDMTWADIDVPSLVYALRRVRRQPWTGADRARVAASLHPFSPDAITSRLNALLDALPSITERRHRST